MVNAILGTLQEGWSWLSAGCIVIVDHWSGIAAFLIFITTFYINMRKILQNRKEKDGKE